MEGEQSQKQGDPLGAYCNTQVRHDGGFKAGANAGMMGDGQTQDIFPR